MYKIPTWGFEIKKKPTNIEFPAVAIAEINNIITERGNLPAKPEVYNPWEKLFAFKKNKK